MLRRAKALRTKVMDEAIIYEWRKQQKSKLDFNKKGLVAHESKSSDARDEMLLPPPQKPHRGFENFSNQMC